MVAGRVRLCVSWLTYSCLLLLASLSWANATPIDARKAWYTTGTVWNGNNTAEWRPFRQGALAPVYGDMYPDGRAGVTYTFTPRAVDPPGTPNGFSIDAAAQRAQVALAFNQWTDLAESFGWAGKVKVRFSEAPGGFPVGWAADARELAAGWTNGREAGGGRWEPTGMQLNSRADYAWRTDHRHGITRDVAGNINGQEPDMYTVLAHEISHMVGVDHPAGYLRPPEPNVWAPIRDGVTPVGGADGLWEPFRIAGTDRYEDPRGATSIFRGWGWGDWTAIATLYSKPEIARAPKRQDVPGGHEYDFKLENDSVGPSDYWIYGLNVEGGFENWVVGAPAGWNTKEVVLPGGNKRLEIRTTDDHALGPLTLGVSISVIVDSLLKNDMEVFWKLPNGNPARLGGAAPDEVGAEDDTGATVGAWDDWNLYEGFLTPVGDVNVIPVPGSMLLVGLGLAVMTMRRKLGCR